MTGVQTCALRSRKGVWDKYRKWGAGHREESSAQGGEQGTGRRAGHREESRAQGGEQGTEREERRAQGGEQDLKASRTSLPRVRLCPGLSFSRSILIPAGQPVTCQVSLVDQSTLEALPRGVSGVSVGSCRGRFYTAPGQGAHVLIGLL